MSSFHKNVKNVSINGAKMKNNLPLISSGIPSLDHIIGGGLLSGTIFAVEEDVLGTYSRVLCKYFLSEGIVCKHSLFIASSEDDPQEMLQELPQPTASQQDESDMMSNSIDKMKIAWRYESLGQVESSFGSNSNFGHHFDLSKYIDGETIKKSDIEYWTCDFRESNTVVENNEGFKNVLYYELMVKIKEMVAKTKNILRINIQSLGSPAWMTKDTVSHYGQDLLKFVYCIKIMIRNTNAVVFLTLPSHLFHDNNLMKRLLYSVDNAIRIESFAGSSKETNPVYKDYHGLVHITKLSAVNSLVPFVPPSLDLAFKLRRKKFVIEKLHLPPELQETIEREQDDITAVPSSVSCGGFKKKDIDF